MSCHVSAGREIRDAPRARRARRASRARSFGLPRGVVSGAPSLVARALIFVLPPARVFPARGPSQWGARRSLTLSFGLPRGGFRRAVARRARAVSSSFPRAWFRRPASTHSACRRRGRRSSARRRRRAYSSSCATTVRARGRRDRHHDAARRGRMPSRPALPSLFCSVRRACGCSSASPRDDVSSQEWPP